MTNVLFYLIVAISLGAFVGAVVFFFLFAFHFLRSREEFKGYREDTLANVFPPFSLFFSQLYSSAGNRHRQRALLFMCLFLICLAGAFGFSALIERLTGAE